MDAYLAVSEGTYRELRASTTWNFYTRSLLLLLVGEGISLINEGPAFLSS